MVGELHRFYTKCLAPMGIHAMYCYSASTIGVGTLFKLGGAKLFDTRTRYLYRQTPYKYLPAAT